MYSNFAPRLIFILFDRQQKPVHDLLQNSRCQAVARLCPPLGGATVYRDISRLFYCVLSLLLHTYGICQDLVFITTARLNPLSLTATTSVISAASAFVCKIPISIQKLRPIPVRALDQTTTTTKSVGGRHAARLARTRQPLPASRFATSPPKTLPVMNATLEKKRTTTRVVPTNISNVPKSVPVKNGARMSRPLATDMKCAVKKVRPFASVGEKSTIEKARSFAAISEKRALAKKTVHKSATVRFQLVDRRFLSLFENRGAQNLNQARSLSKEPVRSGRSLKFLSQLSFRDPGWTWILASLSCATSSRPALAHSPLPSFLQSEGGTPDSVGHVFTSQKQVKRAVKVEEPSPIYKFV
ncbi:uncharacterized protein BDR25DRAFT_313002 [Lindgomyces ingoldianus]|uniref:Uncharacterized protein n=1 Tax=Lindgomyces ingoldianus TaxID=673940 RepID=A0ACB6QZL1_9PLEO|nr:uncharacterized protein BDR25DRAFT_313002 [Lindgomyces ingoldianus]KAF2472479.1 hypothetical protein BDR25DRAFT_313002 [Lindgomyces ingoldianus]